MSKHTPSPWYTIHWPCDGYMAIGSLTWTSGDSAPSHMVKVYPRWSRQEGVTPPAVDECEANACLIAAAPELLEALQWVLRSAGYESGQAEPTLTALSVQRHHLDRARAAVAKATATSPTDER